MDGLPIAPPPLKVRPSFHSLSISLALLIISRRWVSPSGRRTFAQAFLTSTTFFLPHPSYMEGIFHGNGCTPTSFNLVSFISISNAAEATLAMSFTFSSCFSSPYNNVRCSSSKLKSSLCSFDKRMGRLLTSIKTAWSIVSINLLGSLVSDDFLLSKEEYGFDVAGATAFFLLLFFFTRSTFLSLALELAALETLAVLEGVAPAEEVGDGPALPTEGALESAEAECCSGCGIPTPVGRFPAPRPAGALEVDSALGAAALPTRLAEAAAAAWLATAAAVLAFSASSLSFSFFLAARSARLLRFCSFRAFLLASASSAFFFSCWALICSAVGCCEAAGRVLEVVVGGAETGIVAGGLVVTPLPGPNRDEPGAIGVFVAARADIWDCVKGFGCCC
mmetsp:Transcript_30749/g.65348  ORF Transcript_30749/g.65348 Transcript_30749/m.65348 type:complete len:392 (+) Transcript_30749:412-1587(+)